MGLAHAVDAKAGEGGQHGALASDEGELPGWAHGGLLERVVGRQRCPSLHNSVYLSRRVSTRSQRLRSASSRAWGSPPNLNSYPAAFAFSGTAFLPSSSTSDMAPRATRSRGAATGNHVAH